VFATESSLIAKMNNSHSRFLHVYPILRIDLPFDEASPGNSVAATKVFTSLAAAEQEAGRLNELNGKKGCVYVVTTSRLIE
jgi:hypothetical protein